MKKLFCFVLAVFMILLMAGCPDERPIPTNTLYIPETVTIYDETGAQAYAVTYVFEEGWQDKERFTVSVTGDAEEFGMGPMEYSTRHVLHQLANGATIEIFYNAQGREEKVINSYASGEHVEGTLTYDALGRVLKEVKTTRNTKTDAEPWVTTTQYQYVETETGSTCTTMMDHYSVVTVCDKNGRTVSQTTVYDGEEVYRTEKIYDANGKMVSQVTYYRGKKQTEMRYTYKAVEVYWYVAERLPQFQ